MYTLRFKSKKFCQNGCISHHFRDKCVFAFYAEIQYGRQIWRENQFWQKVTDNSTQAIEVHLYNRYHLVGTEKVAEEHIFAKCSKCILNELLDKIAVTAKLLKIFDIYFSVI